MKFSIRDLFLVTVIVALALAWYADHQRFAAEVSKEREFRSNLIEIKEQIYHMPSIQRLWGEPKKRPIGEY
jgi:hypothetical protein